MARIPKPVGAPPAQLGRAVLASLYTVTGPAVDAGNGVNVGTACWCLGRVFASANVDTTFPHSLGRVPTVYTVKRNGPGGQLYDASDGTASWTASSVKLRATIAGTYSFEVM